MLGLYVNSLFVVLSCCSVGAARQANKGAAVQIKQFVANIQWGDPECPRWRYTFTPKRCAATVTAPLPSFHSFRPYNHDYISCRPACTAQTGLHKQSRNDFSGRNFSTASGLRPAFLTAAPDYVSEANLAGEWELLFYPDGQWDDLREMLVACKQVSLADENVFLRALKELYGSSHTCAFSVSSLLSSFMPASRPSIHLKLQPDRLGIPKDTRFPPAVWQLKRRPFSSLYIELEMAFLPQNPQFMLVFEAPVLPGDHFSESVRVHEGTVSFAAAPFLPWQKTRIGRFTLTPKALHTVMDPMLL